MRKFTWLLCLAVFLFVGALTGILFGVRASEQTAFDPDTYNYEALYVKDAVIHYSALDHKEGDPVEKTLATSEGGVQLLLDKINADAKTEWAYGNGYLEISTGSQIHADGIFSPADAADPEKAYTVEYVDSVITFTQIQE